MQLEKNGDLVKYSAGAYEFMGLAAMQRIQHLNGTFPAYQAVTQLIPIRDSFASLATTQHSAPPLSYDHQSAKRNLLGLCRGPFHFSRGNVILFEGEPADYLCIVFDGAVRSCKTREDGRRQIVAFHLPGDFFGWSCDQENRLSAEAVNKCKVVFIKRSSLISIAAGDNNVSNLLLAMTMDELARTQDYSLLVARSATCRVATFLVDLAARMTSKKYIDLPMSRKEIADHLNLTIETVSRTFTRLERSGFIMRFGPRGLIIKSHSALQDIAS